MTIEEIKIRQMGNQYLLSPGKKDEVIRDLLGIQAQFTGHAVHALKIRCHDFTEDTVGDGLVKNWTIRGTIHIFSRNDLPLFVRCNDGRDYRKNQWNDQNFWNQREKWALTPERQAELSQVILAALAENSLSREELREICLQHGMSEAEDSSMFDSWGGGIRLLCERGFIHYTAQEKKVLCLSPEYVPVADKDAKLEMAKRYFTNYGPATIHDAMYFFHATAAQVKAWLDELPMKTVKCGAKEYFYMDNAHSFELEQPRCLFLAGFDPLMLGYEKKESLYLERNDLRKIFNLAGIVLPAIMLDGKIAGKWKMQNRKLSVVLFHAIDGGQKRRITDEAEKIWPDIRKIEMIDE